MRAEANILRKSGIAVISCGGHQEETKRAISHLMQSGVNYLVSFGIAGALSPHLKTGDVILARHVMNGDGSAQETFPLPGMSKSHSEGLILGIRAPLLLAAEKHALYQKTGALAVDTESHLVAESGLPFSIIRAIADQADQDLPAAVLNGLDKKGRARLGPVLIALFKNPRQLPGLIRAGESSGKALRALFRCRGLLLAANTR